jgi:hypothetical protein
MKTYAIVLTDSHPLIPKNTKLLMFDINGFGRQFGSKQKGDYWSEAFILSRPSLFKIVEENE